MEFLDHHVKKVLLLYSCTCPSALLPSYEDYLDCVALCEYRMMNCYFKGDIFLDWLISGTNVSHTIILEPKKFGIFGPSCKKGFVVVQLYMSLCIVTFL